MFKSKISKKKVTGIIIGALAIMTIAISNNSSSYASIVFAITANNDAIQ